MTASGAAAGTGLRSGSSLEKLLRAGRFAVAVEMGPPRGTDAEFVRAKAAHLRGVADAVNVTDNQTAVVHMSSLAAAAILAGTGIEPVLQMVCRDRNRIAMQSDLLGASALGIRNVLCIAGDHPCFGNQKSARKVYDVDSTQLVGMVKRLRDEGKFLGCDDPVRGPFPMFIGAAENPFAVPHEFRALRLAKKVEAGADFVQTQAVFDVEMFRQWMQRVRDLGVDRRCFILAGVIPPKSLAMIEHMRRNVPGMLVPDSLVRRMAGVPADRAGDEGIRIACQIIAEVREIPGVAGVHIMPIGWEHRVREIAERTGLLPRPQP
jgi:methylenetetrahydrofolate reductase (NADPH)